MDLGVQRSLSILATCAIVAAGGPGGRAAEFAHPAAPPRCCCCESAAACGCGCERPVERDSKAPPLGRLLCSCDETAVPVPPPAVRIHAESSVRASALCAGTCAPLPPDVHVRNPHADGHDPPRTPSTPDGIILLI
jgi:hypothetical protein